MPQAGPSACVAARFAKCFVDKVPAAAILPVAHQGFGMRANFAKRNVAKIGMEVPQQRLTNGGMQLLFELGAKRVLAAENPLIANAGFHRFFENCRNRLEVMTCFIFDAALRMAAVVTGEAITASLAGKRLEQRLALGQLT